MKSNEPLKFSKKMLSDAIKNLTYHSFKGGRKIRRRRTLLFTDEEILWGLEFTKEELKDININRDELEALARKRNLIP